MLQMMQMIGGMTALLGCYDLIWDKGDDIDLNKTWSKIGGGILLILVVFGLNKLGVDF